MDLLETLIDSGHIVDVMAVFVVLEVALLVGWRRRTGQGIATAPLLANIGAGGCLMMALRAALTDGSVWVLAAWLVGALLCHLTDLALRWTRCAAP